MGKKIGRVRRIVQAGTAVLTNGYLTGFAKGQIYQGPGKQFCVPGLNRYSCPVALGSCPIGALQAVLGSAEYRMAFYVLGFLLVVGALLGRVVCGWLCPFGWFQELLYRIPFFRKVKKLPGEKGLRLLKYAILVGFVLLIPLYVVDILGQGQPGFCKYICPAGTLEAGWPLVALNPALRSALGWLFAWKSAVLVALILLALAVWRPFCRYLCPLGAVYGLLNPVALCRMEVAEHKCTHCGACQRACPMDIPVEQTPNSPECVRCGACRDSCPHGAIAMGCRESTAPKKEMVG